MQIISGDLHSKGKKIGFVPTMGYLHEGHLSLVDDAKKNADIVVMSIYVNPTQFGRGEDFDKYPRDLSHDEKMAQGRGVDLIFAPSDKEMYPDEHLTFVEVDIASQILEGEFRPTHFKGVATIVTKLFNIVKPDIAVFGQKDAQQAFTVKKMVKDLNIDVEIVVASIVREEDGLALSSRNIYLSPAQRKQATVLFKSLKLAKSMVANGEKKLLRVRAAMIKLINSESEGTIDYVSFVNPNTFEKVDEIGLPAGYPGHGTQSLALVAVRLGETRLIDNMMLETGNKSE